MFDRLNMTFDIDVCAPEGGVPWIPSRQVFSVDDDGLNQKWSGRVWMNPPYSNPGPWVRRFINHAWGVALIPTGNGIWFDELPVRARTEILQVRERHRQRPTHPSVVRGIRDRLLRSGRTA